MDDFWSASFFFSSNLVGRIFFFLLNALQNIFFPLHFSAGFFSSKKCHVFTFIECIYVYIVVVIVIVQYGAAKPYKLYKIMLYKNMFFLGGGLFFLVVFNLGVLDAYIEEVFFYYKISYFKTLFGDFKQSCL